VFDLRSPLYLFADVQKITSSEQAVDLWCRDPFALKGITMAEASEGVEPSAFEHLLDSGDIVIRSANGVYSVHVGLPKDLIVYALSNQGTFSRAIDDFFATATSVFQGLPKGFRLPVPSLPTEL
jgi:hypothetical protein